MNGAEMFTLPRRALPALRRAGRATLPRGRIRRRPVRPGDRHLRRLVQPLRPIRHHLVARCQPGRDDAQLVILMPHRHRLPLHRHVGIDDEHVGLHAAPAGWPPTAPVVAAFTVSTSSRHVRKPAGPQLHVGIRERRLHLDGAGRRVHLVVQYR